MNNGNEEPKIKELVFKCYPEEEYKKWPAWHVLLFVCASEVDPGSYPASYWCRAVSSKAAVYTAVFFWKKWEREMILDAKYSKRPQIEDRVVAEKISDQEYKSAWDAAKKSPLKGFSNAAISEPQAFAFWEAPPEYWRTNPESFQRAAKYFSETLL